jgi:hypothetical protein
VTFEVGCKILDIGARAFANCLSLQSICIPSSIRTVSASCFRGCTNMYAIVFEAGCRLPRQSLAALRSICEVVLK